MTTAFLLVALAAIALGLVAGAIVGSCVLIYRLALGRWHGPSAR